MATIEHHEVEVSPGIRLHYAAAGPEGGRLLILLHGFPEAWFSWRKQIPYFAERGYRVIAPDQRGYNLSERPKAVSQYSYAKLGGDIENLIRALGRERALIVGHDWGAAITWWLAANRPAICEKVAILNVARPDVVAKALTSNHAQRKRSWYMFFFQLPFIPEAFLRKDSFSFMKRSLQGTARKGTFTDEDLEQYVEAWSRPGVVTGMLNWYRAAVRSLASKVRFKPIDRPLLVIWGARDKFLGRELAEPSLAGCSDASIEFVEEASHWVQHEEPELVNSKLEAFFRRA